MAVGSFGGCWDEWRQNFDEFDLNNNTQIAAAPKSAINSVDLPPKLYSTKEMEKSCPRTVPFQI